jgi:hypothetical protein
VLNVIIPTPVMLAIAGGNTTEMAFHRTVPCFVQDFEEAGPLYLMKVI